MSTSKRPAKPCLRCKAPTRGFTGYCRSCFHRIEMSRIPAPASLEDMSAAMLKNRRDKSRFDTHPRNDS